MKANYDGDGLHRAANGVRLWLDGERRRYSAPRGTLTHELRKAVTANRAAIIRHLQEEPPGIVVPEPRALFNAIEWC